MLHVGQPSVAVLGVTPLLYGHASPAGRAIQTVYKPYGCLGELGAGAEVFIPGRDLDLRL